jgi:diguanylate cyclase
MEKNKATADWKERYRQTVHNSEQKHEVYRRKIELLVKAVVALGHMAQGLDEASDRKLAGLRGMFRQPKLVNADLESTVIALEAHARTSFLSKAQVNEELVRELKRLTEQVRSMARSPASKHEIKKFQQRISSLEFFQDEIPSFISDTANIQQSLLSGDMIVPKQSFWQKLNIFTIAPAETEHLDITPISVLEEQSTEQSQLDLADVDAPVITESLPDEAGPEEEKGQILDKRLSLSEWDIDPPTRSTLEYLLIALDPPKDIKKEYLIACNLVSQLENGNDLVTLLEQISTSQDLRRAESDSCLELTKTVSQRVGTLTSGMAAATSLESLKSQVTHNLSDIVGALEKHNTSSDANDKSLSDELASMAERVKQMEKAAVEAEEKIEAQRVRALVDPLTHLPNREAYDQRAHQEIARWMRYQRSLCLAVCDLDLFKRVNDEFGHLAGDKVLKIVAKLIRERLRASDFISRFGGEEFVILLPETEAKEAVAVMEEIREAIANTPFHFRHKQVQITVSIGLTMFQGKDNLKNAFTRADKAMYEAKDSGRNCCRLSSLPEEISDPACYERIWLSIESGM